MSDFEFEEEDFENAPEYGNANYWDERYFKNPEPFEWYMGWNSFKEHIIPFISNKKNCLVLGCGNSPMSYDISLDGFEKVISIDISLVSIELMKNKYNSNKNLEWYQMDCSKLTFDDNYFDFIIDKGTFDALSCSTEGTNIISESMKEIYRVLKTKGIFVEISYGRPSQRFLSMRKNELNLKIHPIVNLGLIGKSSHYFYIFEKL